MNWKVLLVDDDADFREAIVKHLEREGFQVFPAASGDEALDLLQREEVHCILLDIMMPERDGYEICQEMRKWVDVPILMVSAKDAVIDRIKGLEWGADDYITKPFHALELVARIRSAVRRHQWDAEKKPEGEVLWLKDLQLDLQGRVGRRKGEEIPLTPREFAVLSILMSEAGKSFSREDLLRRVWGRERYVDPRIVDVTVKRIREKIEHNPHLPEYILTVWGYGYRCPLEKK